MSRLLDPTDLKESYQNEFLGYIDLFPSPKALYWEQCLLARIGSIISHTTLKEHGVSNSFLLENEGDTLTPPDCKSVVFILTPNVKVIDCTQALVCRDDRNRSGSGKEYHIIAVPSLSYACKNFLKEKGVLKKFSSIKEFPLTILPLDSDVLSMEDADCFVKYNLYHRQQEAYQLVQGLMRFQSLFGLFPVIRAKGDKAKEVAKMLLRMRQEADLSKSSVTPLAELESQTDMLILLDRSVDPLTPLMCQLTYEGLISEKWGIQYGVCRFDGEVGLSQKISKRLPLNSKDELFGELRDQNFVSVGSILGRHSKEISARINESRSAADLSDLRLVVSKLPELRNCRTALEIHTSIAEKLQKFVSQDEFMQSLAAQQSFLEGLETDKAHPYIEDCIFRMAPIDEVLRLLCLQSFCNGGLRQRLLEYYKREVLQVYGFEHIFTLDNLDRIGLLYDSSTISSSEGAVPRVSPAPNSINKQNPISTRRTVTAVSSMFHRTLRRSLRLVVPPPSSALDLSDSDQQLAQIYSGYIPLSVRLVQAMAGGCLHRIPGEINSPASTSTPIPTALALGKRLVSKLNGNTGTNTILGQFPVLGIQNLQSTNMAGLPLPSSQDGGNFILSLVPGVHFEQTQVFSENGDDNKTKDLLKKRSRIQVVVVAFIGGVTHAEISSLRRLATIYDMEIIVITTGIINARTFIRSLSQDMSPVALTVM